MRELKDFAWPVISYWADPAAAQIPMMRELKDSRSFSLLFEKKRAAAQIPMMRELKARLRTNLAH